MKWRMMVLFLCVAPAIVVAQTSTAQSTTEHSGEEFDTRLGTIIERFIDSIQRELHRGFDDEIEDTVKAKTRKSDDWDDTEDELRHRARTYEGETIVDEDEVIDGNIVVKGGDLLIYGEVDGDVLVVGGTVYIKAGGRVTGDVRVINGEIVKEDGGVVEGYMDRTSSRTVDYRERRERFTRGATSLNANWVQELTTLDDFIFRYNRVEGLFLGLGSDKKYYWNGQRTYTGWGTIGYGFKSKRWRGNLGLARQVAFEGGRIFEVGIEAHNVTDTKDEWVISQKENTAAAILIHEDYRDYFQRSGYGANVAYYVQQEEFTGQVRVDYLIDNYTSMDNRTEWSIFGGNKVFRLNPQIDEGRMRSFLVMSGLSTVTRTMYGPNGWSIYGTAEFAGKSSNTDFGFHQYMLDVRRYQPLGRYDNVNVRLRVGTSEGTLPVQKAFELGGLSTVHAYPFKYDVGNRMVLMNAEYIVNGDILHDVKFWPSWFMRGLNVLLLADAGWMNTVPSTSGWSDGFGEMQPKHFRSNLGVGIATRNGSVRLAYVWPTDGSDRGGRFIFRLSRPF
jgi:hypothetical protein